MQELRDLFQVVRGRWLAVVVVTLLGGVIAGAVNLMMPVVYVASARIFIATPAWNDSTAMDSPSAAQKLTSYGDEFTQMRVPSYQRVAVTPAVLGPVIDELGLPMTPAELAGQVTVRAVPDTVMLDVEVRDSSGALAADISNVVAEQLINTIKELEQPAFNAISPVQPVLVSPALVPSEPVAPQVLANIGIGIAFGFVLGLTYAAVRAQRVAQVAVTEDARLLGAVMLDEITETGQVDDIGSDTRFLRVALMAALHENALSTVLLSAPRASELVFQAAVQLAKVIAESGATAVLLVTDFSLRTVASPSPGLSDVLAGAVTLDDALDLGGSGGFAVVPPGLAPASTTSALSGAALRRVIGDLERRFDCVLVVGPAVLESTDAIDLATRAGACALLCPPRVAAADAEDSERLLELAESRYLGRIAVFESSNHLLKEPRP